MLTHVNFQFIKWSYSIVLMPSKFKSAIEIKLFIIKIYNKKHLHSPKKNNNKENPTILPNVPETATAVKWQSMVTDTLLSEPGFNFLMLIPPLIITVTYHIGSFSQPLNRKWELLLCPSQWKYSFLKKFYLLIFRERKEREKERERNVAEQGKHRLVASRTCWTCSLNKWPGQELNR